MSLQTRCQEVTPTSGTHVETFLLIPHFDFFQLYWAIQLGLSPGISIHDGVHLAISCPVNENADICLLILPVHQRCQGHTMRCRELSIVCIHHSRSPPVLTPLLQVCCPDMAKYGRAASVALGMLGQSNTMLEWLMVFWSVDKPTASDTNFQPEGS